MKIAKLISFFLFSISFARAQNKISGRITDNKSIGLQGVSVLILSVKDSSLVKGGISDENGRFSLGDLGNGVYHLKVGSVGFKAVYKTVEVSASVEIPDIKMEPETEELGKVVVTAGKPLYEQKVDRLVINVQKSVTSAGGTALEVLERSPGVQVNRVNNTLVLNGKDEVLVILNISSAPLTIPGGEMALSGSFQDIFTGGALAFPGAAAIEVPAWGYMVLEKK